MVSAKLKLSLAFLLTLSSSLAVGLPFGVLKSPYAPHRQPKDLQYVTTFGKDGRQQITQLDNQAAKVGLLQIQYAGTQEFKRCTGSIVGAGYVLTSAHCFNSNSAGQRPELITFDPGLLYSQSFSFNREYATEYWIHQKYEEPSTADSVVFHDAIQYDLALVHFPPPQGREPLGTDQGHLEMLSLLTTDLPFDGVIDTYSFTGETLGYPGDKPQESLWWQICSHITEDAKYPLYLSDCDLFKGQSGSPLLTQTRDAENSMIFGVISGESPEHSFVAALTKEIIVQIQSLMLAPHQSVSLFRKISVRQTPHWRIFFHNPCSSNILLALRSKKEDQWLDQGWIDLAKEQTSIAFDSYDSELYYATVTPDGRLVETGTHSLSMAASVDTTLPMKALHLGDPVRDLKITLQCQ